MVAIPEITEKTFKQSEASFKAASKQAYKASSLEEDAGDRAIRDIKEAVKLAGG